MIAALVLLAACPQGAQFERPEQQEAACALVEQRWAAKPDRTALARLLEQPEFARARNRHANIFAVLWDQLVAWFKSLFERREAETFARLAPFVVLSVAFAVALAVLLRFVRLRSRGTALRTEATRAEPLALKPAPEHLQNARRLLGASPREAIREALLALLSSLERRNLARPDRVKTNRELCDELPARGADAALVTQVRERVDWYDRTFYSLAAVRPEEAQRFISEIEALV